MKKVMFIIGCLANGGAERVVSSVASGLANKGYDVTILTYYYGDDEYPLSENVKRISLVDGKISEFNKLSSIKKIFGIRKAIKRNNPDKIICFLSHPCVFAYFATIFTKYRKKLVFTVRANPNKEKNKIEKIFAKLTNKINNLIVQNKGQSTCFSKKVADKATIIPNPIYDELFEFEKDYCVEPTKIVAAGRLVHKKNYSLSIDAFNEIHKKHPNVKFYIYGQGPKEEELKNKVKSLGLEEDVLFMGFDKDRNHIYGDKDIYLMTSLYEGMPNTLAEAMTMGVPSISTNCDFGPSDLIKDEKMGILLPDFEVSSVVNALDDMITNYSCYVEKAKYAKEVLKENYSFEKILNKWIEFIEK